MNMSNVKPKRLVIVGGVAGGMSAAARARRLSEESEIIIIERSGYVSYANCGLPYYLGREISEQSDLLLQTPASLKARFNLDVRVNQEVIDIDTQAKVVTVKDLKTSATYQEDYDDLILSVGAAPLRPAVPGIDLPGLFVLRSIEDTQAIERWISSQAPTRVVMAGGGFIGLEAAEQLANRGFDVTLVDSKEQVLTPIDTEMAELVHEELRKHGVRLVLGAAIKSFQPPETLVMNQPRPQSCWVTAGDNKPIPADMVILGLGVRPEVTLAHKANIAIGQRGGITVNKYLQTSADGVWAVGDAIEVQHPLNKEYTLIALGGPANRQGRIVADNIFGGNETYNGTIGTAILRVFDLAVATTGLNETQLKLASLPYEAVHIHPSHHAGYYPGAERLDMKVLFHKKTGLLLGAQVVGKEGVDKRIDVIATAIKAGMTVRDLADLELAYAPPFGSAKDPINLAGMAGKNILDGLTEQVQCDEVQSLDASQFCLLDVRSSSERDRGFIPGSIHIPLPELRNHLADLPAGKDIVTYCQSGQRSYFASRLLQQHGLAVKNLSGGFLTWKSIVNQVGVRKSQPVNQSCPQGSNTNCK